MTWARLTAAAAPAPAPAAPAAAPAPAGAPGFPGVLQQGSGGDGVRQLQARLLARGWQIKVDGDFGPGTAAVVRAFQTDKHLAVDGVVGPQTWAALWSAPVT